MRALIFVLALVATPLALGIAQMPGNSSCDNGNGDDSRSDSGQANAHQGLCAPQPPPPPPPPPPGCVNSTGSGGTGSITGTVMLDVTFTGLAGWCIDVSGPGVTAQAVTDASGNYVVPGLPAGSYLVCEEVQTGFQETSPTSGPTCPSGIGWTISVFDNAESGFVSFTNLPL